jgi:hypothetical protein
MNPSLRFGLNCVLPVLATVLLIFPQASLISSAE